MAGKSKILEVIGEGKSELLLMERVRRALQANERVKYLLTLLQLAQAQAQSPSPNPDDLSLERRRSGLDDVELDQVIPRASLDEARKLRIPGLGRILALAIEETDRMCDPLVLAHRAEAPALKVRLEAVRESVRGYMITDGADRDEEALQGAESEKGADGLESAGSSRQGHSAPPAEVAVPLDFVGRLTSAERGPSGRSPAAQGPADLGATERPGADSLHLVVMDAHKAINSLISELSSRRESVGGADTLGLTDEDRTLVGAFMEGVNSTRHLKGTHPGLASTAVRMGTKLMIQNDVGETDAHVIIVEVEDSRIEITYTDVHEKRVDFFAKLLEELPIRWKKTESRYSAELTESAFILSRGVLKCPSAEEQATALKAIGSSVVFLIDWNKARKRLRNFVRGDEGIEILLWAAKMRIGHMAFLSYGDEELIYEALEALPRGTIRLGEPFTAILGRKEAIEFLKETLKLSLESYERKEPRALLLDRLRVQLLGRAQRRGLRADEMLLELAGLAVECSLTFRDALRSVTRPSRGLIARSHERICRWEERADERLGRIRKVHLKEPQPLLPVGKCVDDALDALEDGGDLALRLEAHLDEGSVPTDLVRILERGAELTVQAAQLFYRIFDRYRALLRGGVPEALFDLINELKKTEQEGDRLKRELRWKFLSSQGDIRLLLTMTELGDKLEESLNALSRAGFLIHDLAYTAMERIQG